MQAAPRKVISNRASPEDASRSLLLAECAAILGTSNSGDRYIQACIISVWGVCNMCDMFVSMCAQALSGLQLIIHYYFSE